MSKAYPSNLTHAQYELLSVVTQITATMRLSSGWSGQHSLLDYSCNFMRKTNTLICLISPHDEYKQSDRSLEQIRFDQAVGF